MGTAELALRVSVISAIFSAISILAAIIGWRASFANTRAAAEEAVIRDRVKQCIDLIEEVRSLLTNDWSATVLESVSIQTRREAEYRIGILQDRLDELFWAERRPNGRQLPDAVSDWLIQFRRAATSDSPEVERQQIQQGDGLKLLPLPSESDSFRNVNAAATAFAGVLHRSKPPQKPWWDHFK